MAENTNMIKEKKVSKILVQINENGDINSSKNSKNSKNKNLNIKKKRECDLSQHCKKVNVKRKAKQKAKRKNINKSKKVTKKLSVSNVLLKCNEDAHKYKIQQLNLMFKQSLKYPTLTQDELYMLFSKYKSDGHYRTNNNLPPITSLLANTHDMINENNHFHHQVPDMQKIRPKNNENTIENSYYNTFNENQYVGKNFKYNVLESTEVCQENNMNDRIENKHLYADQNLLANNNYNHMYINHNVQPHTNLNILNDIHNFAQPKLNSNVTKIYDTKNEHFPCNLINAQNIISEEHQNCKYMNRNSSCNVSNLNEQFKNLSNDTEISQQNDVHYSVQYNNFSLNPNFHNNIHLNKWNNIVSIAKNNNYQSLQNPQSIHIPRITNLESCCNVKNSITSQQLTLKKYRSEEQGDFNWPIHTDVYSVMNDKNLTHVSNNDVSNIEQDFNAYTTNSIVISDNIPSETNTFVPSCASMMDQYN